MQNLRIISAQVTSSTTIVVTFTDNISTSLVTSNVTILADTYNVPDSKVLSIKVKKNTLNITCQPLTNLASYFIKFNSTAQHPFTSLNGNARLIEDNVANKFLILGPIDPENPVKSFLDSYLKDNIYRNEDDNTIINKYIRSLSNNLSRALYDIRQIKNENYLSVDIVDERKVRGAGPFDRLNEESAYKVLRVGRTKTGAIVTNTFNFTDFPYYPITLQKKTVTETLSSDSVDDEGKFNINNLTLNLSNNPVTRINSIIFTLNTVSQIFTYDISSLGYQIKDARYDQEFGFTFVSLENNQIKLNDQILSDPLFSINDIIRVDVEYEYKNLGIVIDPNTVFVYTSILQSREVIPPIINVFNLKHAPIVNSSGNDVTISGVTFIDPNSNIVGAKHPAFTDEILYRLSALPSIPGQYAIDYPTGTVYVFGESLSNDGTGPFPPLATYNYKFTYQDELDYSYDEDFNDLVALPQGSLLEDDATIIFNYEQVLIPEIDYKSDVHVESLNERIENKLLALNVLKVNNSPITNVFRIINETSGEIYTLDRWNNDRVYFRSNNPPNISLQLRERISFNLITNEILFVESIGTNTEALRIFKIFLKNSMLTSLSEDGLGTSFNSSVNFSKTDIFINEKWFNRYLADTVNIERLTNVGEYTIDYTNGIIYCAVSDSQDNNIGTVTYRTNEIIPQFPHLITVDDLYYQIDSLGIKNKTFSYLSFDNNSIILETLDPSDELYLNDSETIYQISDLSIGAFVDSVFVSGISNQIKSLRSIFEYSDLLNSTNPINFVNSSVSNGYDISTSSINKNIFENISFDGTNYYVTIDENIPYFSSNITFTFSVIRASDSAELWDTSGTIVEGNPVKLILSGVNSPQLNELVNVIYTFTINDLSRIVVDYNKGDLFTDYTYLSDEILVSYEYGDNVLDFRTNTNLPNETEYFVTYRVGALRDALLKNFGNLVNIPELTNFSIDFPRERYRDALIAAMSSFIQGPTVTAIKNIGRTISHIEPEIIESAFQNWSLGNSMLYPESIQTTGSFQLLPVKFGNGVLINSSDQTITFPVNSNMRLESGTFETWVLPEWDGLDNNAELTFNILRDGYSIDPVDVFIGASEYHPIITNDYFTLSKLSSVVGRPNTNKDGVFIYYDKDISGNFSRWYVDVVDGYADGYGSSSAYRFKITSNGSFYDTKSLSLPKPSNLSIFSGPNSINFTIASNGQIDEGVTFLSDPDHYLLDFGLDKNKSRLSIYKDVSGYINFKIYDKDKVSYTISTDVSDWKSGDLHHVAISWKINTRNNRDEMHLFIDGFEVPNIIKYGQKLTPYLHEKFRTVSLEEIIGLTDRDIVASVDLETVLGSNEVSSSINFSSFNISIGDIIFIDETGFSSSGYTITDINGQTLTLDDVMPLTISDGKFSVNRTQFIVTSDIDIAPNTAVTTIHADIIGSDISTTVDSNIVTSTSVNFTDEGILPGYIIHIDNPSLNITYTILQVDNNSLTINDSLSISLTNTSFQIYSNEENEIPGIRALRPAYSVSKDNNFNNILTISNDVVAHDLILIRTLGLNHRKVKKQYYVWSDNKENILMTLLPPPISLDETKITKIILPTTFVGPTNSILSSGVFTSNNFSTSQPSNSQNGRSVSVTLSGNNVDFTTPTQVTINGVTGIYTISETINFSDYGTLDFANQYISINSINVVTTPINSARNALTLSVKEKYSITHGESSGLIPVVKYSYHIGGGYSLQSDGVNSVRDENSLFSNFYIGNYLVIHSPASVAGFYIIDGISDDRKTLTISSTSASFPQPLSSFTNGIYQILNVNDYRSGLQNGFFIFETSQMPSQPYFLSSGFYELEYFTYANIKMDPLDTKVYLGSDLFKAHQFNGAIDQVKIYSSMLIDTRIGESIPSNQRSITKDFNSIKVLKKDNNTLSLINFDSYPFINDADFIVNPSVIKKHFQSSIVVNENFNNSLVITDDPLVLSNDGILDTKKEGTIEFWTSPFYDTGNDPNNRFYFDAYGATIEEAVSVNNTAVKISAPASQILKVTLKGGDQRIDYFAGGKLEIDTQHAIQEESVSISNNTVLVSKSILQVISIKIIGDFTETDYFDNGTIGTDQKTIYLGKLLPGISLPLLITYQSTDNKNIKLNTQVIRLNKKLPSQNSNVIINYIPKGLQGDRISIFKDEFGYVNFTISASSTDFVIRAPTRWVRDTWHRVKASYKMNSGIGVDEMRLFLDGYEYSDILFGTGLVAGPYPFVMGSVSIGDGYGVIGNIKFKDSINDLFIGSEYTRNNPIFSLIDNFRISNLSRPIYAPYGEPLDVNFNTNRNVVFPVTEDLYTTYLLDFDSLIVLNDDFTILRDRKTGSFDFSVNIFDSFGIVDSSIKSQEALEKLIRVLKPANSKCTISYIK